MQPLPARIWAWIQAHRLELALVVVFAAVSIQYIDKALDNRSAVLRWREQVLDLDDGEDIYRTHVHPNPPITALMLRPLMELPPVSGAVLWFVIKAGMALLVYRWVFQMIETPDRPFPLWAKALAVVLSIRPIVGDLTHGNINILILFLVVAGLYAYHRGRDLFAGGLIGLSIAAKVTPLLFVPYFIYKRAWKTLAGCAAALVVFVWLVPGLLLGFEENAALLTSWRKQMIDPFVTGGAVVYSVHSNQSLPGVVARLTTASPSFWFFAEDIVANPNPVEWWYHNILALHPKAADWLFVKTALLLFAGAVVWSCRTPAQPRQGWRRAAEFSLVMLGMLIFSERTWKHHCVLLVLPFSVLAHYLAAYRPTGWPRGYLIATLAGVVLLMSTTSTSLMGRELGKLAQVYGAYLWANVLLAVSMVVLLRSSWVSADQPPAKQAARTSLDFLPGLRSGLPRRTGLMRNTLRQPSPLKVILL